MVSGVFDFWFVLGYYVSMSEVADVIVVEGYCLGWVLLTLVWICVV